MSRQLLTGLLDIIDDEEEQNIIKKKIKIVDEKIEELKKKWEVLKDTFSISAEWIQEVDNFIAKEVLYYGKDELINDIRVFIHKKFIEDGYSTFFRKISHVILKDAKLLEIIKNFINYEERTHSALIVDEKTPPCNHYSADALIESYRKIRSLIYTSTYSTTPCRTIGIMSASIMFEFCDKMNLFEISKLCLNIIKKDESDSECDSEHARGNSYIDWKLVLSVPLVLALPSFEEVSLARSLRVKRPMMIVKRSSQRTRK